MAENNYPEIGKLLKPMEVASLLRISRTQAYRLMRTGELPAVRFGTANVRVRLTDLTKFITDHTAGSSSSIESK